MTGINTRNALLAALGCLLLAGCDPAKPATVVAGADPAGTSTMAAQATTAAATTATAQAAGGGGGGGLTACKVVTEEEATAALGHPAGPGTPGGTAALSECIYDQGALIIGMKTNSKAEYNKSRAAALAKGATDLSGVGDSGFAATTGAGDHCTLLLLKGTTLVSIIFGGPGAMAASVAVAKVAAAKL